MPKKSIFLVLFILLFFVAFFIYLFREDILDSFDPPPIDATPGPIDPENPFGRPPEQITPPTTNTPPIEPPTIDPITPPNENSQGITDKNQEDKVLKKLFNGPTAGYVTVDNANDTKVLAVERGTGYIYEINNSSPKPKRITNTLIPLAFNAEFIDDKTFLLDYYTTSTGKEVETLLVSLQTSEKVALYQTISAIPFPQNTGYAISQDGSKIFYLTRSETKTTLSEYSLQDKSSKDLYSTPFASLSVGVSDNKPILSSKPSVASLGTIYGLEGDTLIQVAPEATALTYISNPFSSSLLTSAGGLSISSPDSTISVNASTLPEKCSWVNVKDFICGEPLFTNAYSNDNHLNQIPDSWYKGQVYFVDTIKLFKPPYQTPENLYVPIDGGLIFDLTDVKTSEEQKLVFFTNKTNGSLWSLSYK